MRQASTPTRQPDLINSIVYRTIYGTCCNEICRGIIFLIIIFVCYLSFLPFVVNKDFHCIHLHAVTISRYCHAAQLALDDPVCYYARKHGKLPCIRHIVLQLQAMHIIRWFSHACTHCKELYDFLSISRDSMNICHNIKLSRVTYRLNGTLTEPWIKKNVAICDIQIWRRMLTQHQVLKDSKLHVWKYDESFEIFKQNCFWKFQ